MAWEVESEHVDLAEMRHEIRFVNREVKTRDGEPQRHHVVLLLGQDLLLEDDGRLVSRAGVELNPKVLKELTISQLEAQHEKGRAYARRHGIKVL